MFWILFLIFLSIFSLIGGAFNGLASLKDMAFSNQNTFNDSNSNPNLVYIIIAIVIIWIIF